MTEADLEELIRLVERRIDELAGGRTLAQIKNEKRRQEICEAWDLRKRLRDELHAQRRATQ